MFYYMHNNTNYQCKICWNKALTFGVGSIQLSFRIYIPLCSPNACKYVFNPNVTCTTFQSNCAEGLHFSAFIFTAASLLFVHLFIYFSFLFQYFFVITFYVLNNLFMQYKHTYGQLRASHGSHMKAAHTVLYMKKYT